MRALAAGQLASNQTGGYLPVVQSVPCASSPGVSYTVHYDVSLEGILEEGQREIERTMGQIAEVVSTVPDSSPFWSSMKGSVLQIDVGEWRVVYRIDARRHEIHVVGVEPRRR